MSEAPKPIWAKKGETVVCISGHPICEVACDIYMGDERDGAHFVNWQQPQPARTVAVPEIRCALCRGVWIRGNPRDNYQFHFADGWR